MAMHTLLRKAGYCALASALSLAMTGAPSANAHEKTITLIQVQDLHGQIVPHPGIIHNLDGTDRDVSSGGGLAKTKTVIQDIRDSSMKANHKDNTLTLAVGDTIHGTAEVLFTVGDVMIPILNTLGIDAYTPGNWEFGYGPAVFRNHFTPLGTVNGLPSPKPPLPANIQVMAGAVECSDVADWPQAAPGIPCVEMPPPKGIVPFDQAHRVMHANFPSIAINLYNDADTAPGLANVGPNGVNLHNTPVLPGYKIFTVDGVNVAVIGITAAIVPQQASVFNIGLRFTQGVEELPGVIDEVKAKGADVIVVQSELGLSQNLAIGQRFKDVDVILSAHTHETTLNALVASDDSITPMSPDRVHRLRHGNTVVVETTEDMYVGRLDLLIDESSNRATDFKWEAVPVDDDVKEDGPTKAMVDAAVAPFYGKTTVRHTFMPGGYCKPGVIQNETQLEDACGKIKKRGLQLTEGLETVVGYTDVTLHRDNVLEDEINNFIADAIFYVTDTELYANEGRHVDMSMTNGFRFGNPILPGPITLGDLYTQFPISPATAVAEFSGKVIENDLERVLGAVFDRNPFLQRGGWYVGLANMTQKIDLVNRPFSSSGGRIVETTINGEPLDPSKRYTFASCFPHGDALDRVCRTNGGTGHEFFQLSNPDKYDSNITLVPPLNDTHIIDVHGPVIKQEAPDAYLHPVHIMRRYLDYIGGRITAAMVDSDRIKLVDSTKPGNPETAVQSPVSEIDPLLIQPPEGAGPMFFGGLSGIGDGNHDHYGH